MDLNYTLRLKVVLEALVLLYQLDKLKLPFLSLLYLDLEILHRIFKNIRIFYEIIDPGIDREDQT